MNRQLVTCMCAPIALTLTVSARAVRAGHRRPASAIRLCADGPADAVSRLRSEDVGWKRRCQSS